MQNGNEFVSEGGPVSQGSAIANQGQSADQAPAVSIDGADLSQTFLSSSGTMQSMGAATVTAG